MSKLFEPTQLKQLALQNRVAMAPMTRARTSQPGNIPNQMMATYYKQRADEVLEKGYADLVAFGRPFVSNPDLVARLQHQQPLAELDGFTLFGGNEYGYTDYSMCSK
ncbi:TPA: hypothetical protein ACX6QF_003152 [Photobacterium damselae]